MEVFKMILDIITNAAFLGMGIHIGMVIARSRAEKEFEKDSK